MSQNIIKVVVESQALCLSRCLSTTLQLNLCYNQFQNILRLFDVLLNFPFAASETVYTSCLTSCQMT